MILGCFKIGEKELKEKITIIITHGQTRRQTMCYATFSILSLLLLNLRLAYSSVTSNTFTF